MLFRSPRLHVKTSRIMYFIGNSYIPYFDIHYNQVTRDTIPDLLTLMNKPFSHIAERRVLVLLLCGKITENVFPPLNGRKLKKSAYDELQDYYRERME